MPGNAQRELVLGLRRQRWMGEGWREWRECVEWRRGRLSQSRVARLRQQREDHTLGTDGRVLLRGKKSADVGRTHRVENLRRAVVLSAMA